VRLITVFAVIGTGLAAALLLKRRAPARGATARDRGNTSAGELNCVKEVGQQTPIKTLDSEAWQRLLTEPCVIPSLANESVQSCSEPLFSSADLPPVTGSEIRQGRAQTASRADSELNGVEAPSRTKMRITKRSSGGRGEYELSESFGSLTPRDLVNHTILLNLGSQVKIATGVRLLLKHGKLRLRIDEEAVCEIHLHRQLAAALMLPYPAREESAWASDFPTLKSGLYGIRNITFSSVILLTNCIARMVVDTISVANQAQEEYVQASERLNEILQVWERHAEFPPELASLLAEHNRLVQAGGPLGLSAEKVVSDLQEAAAEHCQVEETADFSASHDVLPLLIRFLQSARLKGDIERTSSGTHSPQDITADTALPVIFEVEENDALAGISVTVGEPASYKSRVSTNAEFRADVQSKQDEALPEIVGLGVANSLSAPLEDSETARQAAESEEADSSVSRPPSPRRYRPQPRGAVVSARRSSKSVPSETQRDLSLSVDLHLRSRIGGTYTLTFLPLRRLGLPSELEVIHVDQRIQLSALHEDWYQDVVLPEMGRLLREGLAWYTEGSDSNFRWSLAGREVFVFGTRDDLSGFISVPRLILGAQHIVICCEEIFQQVLDILRECCEHLPQTFGESDGLPAGWVGIGPVVPTLPLPSSEAGDILDALRPDPAIVIELGGGVCIQHSQFLINYPPHIRVYGSIPDFVQVMINGRPGEKSEDGYTNMGWDSLGEHVVACGAISRSYTVVEPDDDWESWNAYCFNLSGAGGEQVSASICGALVTSGSISTPAMLVPVSTPVLLGSRPGEIYTAPIRKDTRIGVCPAFPPFAPIWAVPQNPLRADKAAARVELVQERAPTPPHGPILRPQQSRAIHQWCTAILDCCRKGLDADPPDDHTRRLWKSYRDLARRLWRASR
jgi:hypothetical protein